MTGEIFTTTWNSKSRGAGTQAQYSNESQEPEQARRRPSIDGPRLRLRGYFLRAIPRMPEIDISAPIPLNTTATPVLPSSL